MSIPYVTTRTNYFQTTDKEKFKDIVSKMHAGENAVKVFELENGYVGFGAYSSIDGIQGSCDDETCEADYDAMVYELQQILPDGEAIMIISSGHEKLRAVWGDIIIITNKDSQFLTLADIGITAARKMLSHDDWNTRYEC